MGRIIIVGGAIALLIFAAFACAGCNFRAGMDNTASGGGNWGFGWSRCPIETQPVGGNAAAVPNKTTKGGGVNVVKP